MKRFSEFLQEQYYYHGTTPEAAAHIEKHGLNPSKSKYNKTLYLTTHHGEAQRYSKAANNGKHGVVLMIHKNAIKDKHKKSDRSGVVEYGGKIHRKHIKRI